MERSRPRVTPSARIRKLLLLTLVLFILATAVPDGSRPSGTTPRRNPQLDDAGPAPLAAG